MKKLFTLFAIAAIMALAACSTTGPAGTPDASQVAQIQMACAVDAGLRPQVTVLISLPGVATPEAIAAVVAARGVIDTVCANPAGSVQANALAAFSGATATVLGFIAQSKMPKPAATPAASAPVAAK